MSDVADYIGRTVDLVYLFGDKASGDVLMTQALATPEISGEVCTGMKKLAQRFLLELFTEKGSMPFLPDRGTDFTTAISFGAITNQLEAIQAFSEALTDLTVNLQLEESDTDPDEERFKTAELLQMTFSSGAVSITVRIISLAETAATFIFPLPIPVIV